VITHILIKSKSKSNKKDGTQSRHQRQTLKGNGHQNPWPTKDHDVTLLKKELIAIAATIPTTLGGGNHGHAGLIVEPAKYLPMTGGTAFTLAQTQESTQQD
jgi:hypothetical protein